MARYNKAIGSLIGGIVGIGGAMAGLPESADSQITSTLLLLLPVILSTFGTYVAPKNKG